MTLTINLEGYNYLNVESFKGGNNQTMSNVVVIDSNNLLENTEECIKQIKEWKEDLKKRLNK